MSRPRFTRTHFGATRPVCKPSLRIYENNMTDNTNLVTCKTCRKALELPPWPPDTILPTYAS